MTDHEPRGSGPDNDLQQALDGFLRSKGKGPDRESGSFRRNAARECGRFADYCRRQGHDSLGDIDARTLRRYVRDELLDRDLAPATVQKYYDYLSAWVGWGVREGIVPEHYGIQQAAREPLPDTTQKADQQQTWFRDDRQQFLSYLDERAHEAIDEDGTAAYHPVRDRALAYILAYVGVRGAELLAAPDDDRRDGAAWGDLGDDYVSLDVLGKSQQRETRSVPPQARPAIERWASVYRPDGDWPIIPSFHRPSLYAALPAAVDTDELDGLTDVFEALHEHDRRPPALTTNGARSLFRRLTEAAGIDVEEGYLQLHGARRGVGRVIAMEQGADATADQLGNSVRVVEEDYSEVLAEERAEATGAAFEQHDES
jgi:integrase